MKLLNSIQNVTRPTQSVGGSTQFIGSTLKKSVITNKMTPDALKVTSAKGVLPQGLKFAGKGLLGAGALGHTYLAYQNFTKGNTFAAFNSAIGAVALGASLLPMNVSLKTTLVSIGIGATAIAAMQLAEN